MSTLPGSWANEVFLGIFLSCLPAIPQPATSVQPLGSTLTPKELEAHWASLARDDAPKAYKSILVLVEASRQSVSFLKEHLRPVSPADPKQVGQWIADLDSNRFSVRKKAADALEKLGELAEPGLREALKKKPSLELQRRLELLLKKLEGPVTSPEALRLLRSVEILEHIGTPDAQDVLKTLAKGAPGARCTREAIESLERLRRRSGTKQDVQYSVHSKGAGRGNRRCRRQPTRP